jgi:hypothetical protein
MEFIIEDIFDLMSVDPEDRFPRPDISPFGRAVFIYTDDDGLHTRAPSPIRERIGYRLNKAGGPPRSFMIQVNYVSDRLRLDTCRRKMRRGYAPRPSFLFILH